MVTETTHHDLFLKDNPLSGKMQIAQILCPMPVSRAYDYQIPADMQLSVGDYVLVPLGPRQVIGVVWSLDQADETLNPKKIKTILEKFTCPPMPADLHQLIEILAKYNMADMGSVLKMALSQPKALNPAKPEISYMLFEDGRHQYKKLTAQRKNVIAAMAQGQAFSAKYLADQAGCGTAVVKKMAELGMIQQQETAPMAPCHLVDVPPTDIELSPAQAQAADQICGAMDQGEFTPFLLDGVTGAGKTEVYFEAVSHAIKQGKQVLILLPEIALSAQFISRFKQRYGIEPAIWHSDISQGKKQKIWRGVAMGQTNVVAGARSALFLPFTDLGLVVVDEEHDASYKQEEGVIYNARDMAVMRAKLSHAPVILASATPALESWVNMCDGKYQQLELPSRHGGAVMPDMHMIDLREDKPERQCFIAPSLRQAMHETIEAGEQAMLFLNRRGYAPLTLCRHCGYRFQCPSCTAWLVEHKQSRGLHCHHCGYKALIPKECPECETEDSLAACGPGVERIAEEVQNFMPDARVMLLTSDIMQSPQDIKAAIDKISAGEVDVLIGTQIIAKGHHFPNLTCVGIIDADLGLAGADLRAGERTYQLLHQVSGRAGRGLKPGHVYLQTYMPEHQVLQAVISGDRNKFLDIECQQRKQAAMPPFGKLAALVISGPDEMALDQYCAQLAQIAPQYDGVQVLGPAAAAMAILRGQHRRRFLIKAEKHVALQKVLGDWVAAVKRPYKMRLKIDIDPQSFL